MHSVNQTWPFEMSLMRVNRGIGWTMILLPIALYSAGLIGLTCAYASLSHFYYARIFGDLFVLALGFVGILMIFFYRVPKGTAQYKSFGPLANGLTFAAGVCILITAFVPTPGSGCLYGEGTSGLANISRALVAHTIGQENYLSPDRSVTGDIRYGFWVETEDTSWVHLIHISAAGLALLLLAALSWFVFTKDNCDDARTLGKHRRNIVYRLTAVGMAVSVFGLGGFFGWIALFGEPYGPASDWWAQNNLTLRLEIIALTGFGVSWLMKGRFWRPLFPKLDNYFHDPRVRA